MAEETKDIPEQEQAPAEQAPAEQPAAEQPAAEQPAAEQAPAEQPAAEQPAAEQPAAGQPAAEQPAAEQPAAEQPAAEQAEAPDAVGSAERKLPENHVTVEDAGTLRKKITIEVPRERIDAKFDELFGELNRSAAVPGFRVGRAPRRLVEKRFSKEIAGDVRNAVVGEAAGSALEGVSFKPVGEPDIDLDAIELPDDGAMTFSFEVETAPEFELPEYKGIEIKRPVVTITDEYVDKALTDIRRPYGKLRPVKAAAGAGDSLVVDVSIVGDGVDYQAANVELRVAPGEVEGVPLEDLGEVLVGKKPGATCSLKTRIPAAHPTDAWRDKDVEVRFKVHEVKRLELPAIDDALAERAGFASLADMREAVVRRLRQQVEAEQTRHVRDQVRRHFLEHTDLEVPEAMAERHTAGLLRRRCVELMSRGVPREQIEQRLDELERSAADQAATDLKVGFILGKLAEEKGIEVSDAEVNAEIARIARGYNRRPERLRQEMKNDGTLDLVAVALREEKAIDDVLKEARVVDVTAKEDKPGGEAPAGEGERDRRGQP